MKEKLRVVEISIKGLFGLYDHVVALNQNDRITIIHGPNGVGKTILLKCLSALFTGRFYVLRTTPFSSFAVRLSDETEVIVHRGEGGQPNGRIDPEADATLSVEIRTSGRSEKHDLKASADVTSLAKIIERETPWLIQINETIYMDQRSSRHITAEEVVDRYLKNPRSHTRMNRIRNAEPEALRDLRERVNVRFIETNRLFKLESDEKTPFGSVPSITNTVNDYAKALHAQIEAALAQYGRKSQQLDQSFPQRLIQEEVNAFELEALKTRLESLEMRHKKLSDIGLLDKAPTRPFDTRSLDAVSDAKLVPMTLYLLDSEEKIAVFDSLAGRVQVLLDSVNKKFRNKRLVISRELGLVAAGNNKQVLSLDSLSSGEQHEIVLLYELLFNISPDTLVLIDEPELSLHVTWQKMFLPELLSVSAKVGFDAVIATHSPFVVGGRRDLMVALDAEPDGLYEEDVAELQRRDIKND